MSDETSGPERSSLPDAPSLEWLRKQAKRRLAELRQARTRRPARRRAVRARQAVRLPELARAQGTRRFPHASTDSSSMPRAPATSDALRALLDEHPDKLSHRATNRTHGRCSTSRRAQGQAAASSTVSYAAARARTRSNTRETRRQHLRDALGRGRRASLDVVRALADAGGDVVGHGDDHELEVIGWATLLGGMRRRRAPRRRRLPRQPRRAAPHLLGDRDAIAATKCDGSSPRIQARPQSPDEPQRRQSDCRSISRCACIVPEMVALLDRARRRSARRGFRRAIRPRYAEFEGRRPASHGSIRR